MKLKKQEERNKKILELAQCMTFADIGRVYGLSKQRITQICKDQGFTSALRGADLTNLINQNAH